ncbi:MAG: DUF11 domain-containing protein, partial [Runella slithyformis]
TPGNGNGTPREGDEDDETITIKVLCPVPPTPTCGGPETVTCPPNGCVNVLSFIKSVIRTPGGTFEIHTTSDPTAPGFAASRVADPTCVKTSGNYYIFEKAACGEYSNGALLMLTIKPCEPELVDLSLTIGVSNTTPAIGDELTYTITVRNAGPAVATNVEVKSLLPAGLQFVSGVNFTASGNTLTSTNIPAIGVGGTIILTFKAKVIGEGSLVVKAQVSKQDQTDVDSTPNNGYDNTEDDRDAITIQTGCPVIAPPVLACAITEICPGGSTSIRAVGCEDGTVLWSNGATGVSITVSPATTTVYTAVCKKGTCSSALSNGIRVVVDTPTTPTITVSPSSTVCAGNSVTLTAANCAGTIVWSTGATGIQITVVPGVTTTYTATCKIGECVSPATSATITVTPGPAAPEVTSSTQRICSGESVTLEIRNCAGIAEWSTGQTGAAIVVTPTTTTSYSAVCSVNGCKSASSALYTITVAPLAAPVISASPSTVICTGGSVILTATGCTGTVLWSNGATGASTSVSPVITTTYTAICRVGVCTSGNSNALTITVGNPAAPTISASTALICSGESATLTATGTCAGTFMWSNGATGASITVSPMVTTDYTAVCKVGTCESPASNTRKITVNTAGTAPTVKTSKPSICLGETVTLTAEGCAGAVIWSTGATTASITVSPITTTTYTASCKATTGKCDSPAGSVTVSVGNNTTPPTISVSPASTICAGTQVTLTASGCVGGTITWSTGAVANSITVTPNATTTYTATCKVGNCESTPASTTITVVPVPAKPVVICSAEKVCPGESLTLEVKDCPGTVMWSTGQTGAAIVVTPTTTTTYTAICKVGNCESPVSNNYTITVTPLPAITVTATKSTITVGENTTLTVVGCEGEIVWSNTMTGASIIVSPSSTTTYTATCRKGACSTTGTITITVNTCRAPSIAADKDVICEGGSVRLTATGCTGTVEWSTGATGASITVNPMATTTYTAVCVCTPGVKSAASSPVTIVVTKVAAPTLLCSSNNICIGESVTLTANNCAGTVMWSNGATGASLTVSPQVTTTYTAMCKVGACESPASSACVINVGTPETPRATTSNGSVCFGQSATLTATGSCAGFFIWSNGQVGASITITPAATATYTVVCCTSNNCKSVASNPVTVTVSAKLAEPQVVNLANACPFVTVDLAKSVRTIPAGLTLEFRTTASPSSPLVSNPSAVGTSGTYFAFFRSSDGCYSAAVAVSVLITRCQEDVPCRTNPATADAGIDAVICAALSYKLNGKIGGAATGATWSSNGPGRFDNALALDAVYYPTIDEIIKGETILTLTTNDPDGAGACRAGTDQMKLVFEGIKFRPQIIVNGVAKTDTLPSTVTICQGEKVRLKASETGFQYKLFKNGVAVGPASNVSEWEITEPGVYNYGLVDSRRCCSVPSASVVVNVGVISNPVVKNMRNICPATTVDLTRPVSTVYALEFRAVNDKNAPLVATPTAVSAGTYYAFHRLIGGTCYSAGSPLVVKIFDCATDTARADVSIKKMVDKTRAAVNEMLNYTIVVKNNGNSTATNIDICDKLPVSVLVSSPGMEIDGSGILRARINRLAKGDSATFRVTVRASKSGSMTNLVELVYADQVDPVLANNRATATTEVTGVIAANQPNTPPTTGLKPEIGVALAVDNINKKLDNTYDVTYVIKVKNTGNVPLTNVQVADSITKAIAPPATFTVVGTPTTASGSTLVPNPSFNGTTNKNILTGGTLAVEQEEKITIVININPNGSTSTFPGSVTATGQNGSTGVTDNSNTGVVVNQPVNTPTPVRFDLPSTLIGLAKSAGIPEKLGGGKFKIPYTISVTNLGTTNLAKVQVMDDLTKTFGSKAMIMGIPTVTADSGFVVDSTYRGAGLLTNLLVDSLSSLPKGITRKINLAVTVMLASADSINIFNNIAVGIGKTSGGVMASDTSTVGNNPDPNGTLDPRSSNVPTPITLNSLPGRGLIGVALSVKDTARQGDGSFNITYRVLVKNFGSGVLNNVQLKDTIANVFNELTGASFSVVGTPTASDSSELRINPGFDGDLDVNLLIAEQSRLSGGRLDSLFFTVNVKTDGRLTPYLNQVHARALAGSDVVQDISTNGLNPDPNGNNNPTELSEQEPTAVVISSDGGELVVPEGFSPNGDGINDKFLIRHPSGTKLVVEIYNRWMHLVYRNNQYENDWDGTANVGLAANNQGLPVGTYFYNVILQDANGSEIKRQTRFMTINR